MRRMRCATLTYLNHICLMLTISHTVWGARDFWPSVTTPRSLYEEYVRIEWVCSNKPPEGSRRGEGESLPAGPTLQFSQRETVKRQGNDDNSSKT